MVFFDFSLLLCLHLSLLHFHLPFPIVHPVFCLPKTTKGHVKWSLTDGQLFDGSIKVLELVLTYLVNDLYATL